MLEREGGRVSAVRMRREGANKRLAADAFLVCMGSFSPVLLAPVGIRVPIYPLKGYSVALPADDATAAPTVSITDEAMKIVISRLGNRLRAAGTAEVDGYDTELNAARCGAAVEGSDRPSVVVGRREQMGSGHSAGVGQWRSPAISGHTRTAAKFPVSGHPTGYILKM